MNIRKDVCRPACGHVWVDVCVDVFPNICAAVRGDICTGMSVDTFIDKKECPNAHISEPNMARVRAHESKPMSISVSIHGSTMPVGIPSRSRTPPI